MKRLFLLAAAAALVATTSVADAKDWKKVRIGVEGAYPPFSETTPSGELKGFDIDIAWALCEEMKVECELVKQDWDGIIPALLAKKYDAILASMSITPERQKKVDFAIKYYSTPAKFIAREGVDWTDTNDGLKDKVIGLQRGTTHQAYMEKHFPDVEVKLYGTQDEVYLDLQAGRIDAIMADSVAMLDGFLKTESGKGYAFFGGEHYDREIHGDGAGIAIRKGEDDLRLKFNAAIEAIRKNGTYDRISKKYFEFDVYGS